MKLEICANSFESACTAQEAGAHRIELCANLEIGGTTPSYATIALVKQRLHIPTYVLIRPRAGDFLYSQAEYDCMAKDIEICRQLGCEGVVIGLLFPDGSVDKERTTSLVKIAEPMGVTFHRAFDCCQNPLQALEDIIATGCQRILTSGQQASAIAGAAFLQELVEQANDRISIMPGSGINSANIEELIRQTKAKEFHCSAKKERHSEMTYVNECMQQMGAQPSMSNLEEIKAIVAKIKDV
ncbi:copper homeostasis protein CutC [Olivibacter sitiensis]|uniref:copper homeostasis protein CutC n=1 Tax=Olivibacter sitiensis TaxID=376470 RepID=UPI000400735A|nr:copper homeostasis protein CutC [Olivibacter sitiensis]